MFFYVNPWLSLCECIYLQLVDRGKHKENTGIHIFLGKKPRNILVFYFQKKPVKIPPCNHTQRTPWKNPENFPPILTIVAKGIIPNCSEIFHCQRLVAETFLRRGGCHYSNVRMFASGCEPHIIFALFTSVVHKDPMQISPVGGGDTKERSALNWALRWQ